MRPTRRLIEAAVISAVVWVAYFNGIDDFALVWDEGMTIERLDKIETGWRAFREGDMPISEVLDRYWCFSREEPDGHGPFYALLSLGGHLLTRTWLPPPDSYRVAGITLFAVALFCTYATLRSRWSLIAAATAVLLLAACPRIVPEVSFALIDGPLASLSLLAFASFIRAERRRTWHATTTFGVIIGLAMATKFTGWFLPMPYIVWTLVQRDRRLLSHMAITAVVALLTVSAVNIGWWPSFPTSIATYFESNLTRRETIPIGTLFLGTRYPFSLPWYNTLVWTIVAVPVLTTLLGYVGAIWAASRFISDGLARLLLLNWLLLMIVRALPQAPGHDGTRQIVIALAFLCLLAGYAIERLLTAFTGNAARGIVYGVAIASIAESGASVLIHHPLELSYYSPVVGGLPGATRMGFEPTYFWDAVTPEVLDWINRNTPEGQWVLFRNYTPSFEYLRKWGVLRPPAIPARTPPRWVVYQHRPGIFNVEDEWLIENVEPEYRKTFLGVPLISIYPYDAWRQSRQSTEARDGWQ